MTMSVGGSFSRLYRYRAKYCQVTKSDIQACLLFIQRNVFLVSKVIFLIYMAGGKKKKSATRDSESHVSSQNGTEKLTQQAVEM